LNQTLICPKIQEKVHFFLIPKCYYKSAEEILQIADVRINSILKSYTISKELHKCSVKLALHILIDRASRDA